MKKTVHIISHSHLDREWYLPLIEHQMYLVDLIDNILELSKDSRFNSFHLDGQVIPLEDYLKIKPENREKLIGLISSGKLKIGPWYVLQDSFLISAESNLRNLQVGIKEAKRYLKGVDIKEHMFIGYFPDTFGNVGQMPQILKRAGIDIAYFGRGVKATGFDNIVVEDFTSKNSEMYWSSKNSDKVLGILFANWYCNAIEIPVDKNIAKTYWDQKIKDVEKYASTSHLLMMNGCDHQPLQMNILDAIDTANELYDDYEFIHSNLFDYYKAVKKEVFDKKLNLNNINGELRSQKTDGWYTLQGTSSNRVILKKQNKKAEFLLEEVVEPLLYSIYDKKQYPYDAIHYAYKTLISNHPHDSICGTGIDSIHKGMLERFKEVIELSNHLVNRALYDFSKNVNTTNLDYEYMLSVHNINQYSTIKEIEAEIDYKTIKFKDMHYQKAYELLKNENIPKSVIIYDGDKEVYRTNLKQAKVLFDYKIPDDSFRVPYWTQKLKFNAVIPMEAFSRKVFNLKFLFDELEKVSNIKIGKDYLENEYIKLSVNNDGTFNLYNKKDKIELLNLGVIEDNGDVGNEYIYKRANAKSIYSNENQNIKYNIKSITKDKAIIEIYDTIKIPVSAENDFEKIKEQMQEVTIRNVKRADDLVEFKIIKTLELNTYDKVVKLNIKFNNIAKDHRLRILFANDIKTDYVYPESIYEVVKRPIMPSKEWLNPDNSQNLNRFVNLRDENMGLTIGTNGIAEYEVLKDDNTLALSIGRYTGEIGDWGYFPTEDSQEQGEIDLDLYIDLYKGDEIKSYHRILEYRKQVQCIQIYPNNKGNIEANKKLDIELGNNMLMALNRNENKTGIIRLCNYSKNANNIKINSINELNILENEIISIDENNVKNINAYEIRTFELGDNDAN
ncbi:alpha-mannosidase [Oceanivirga salmonicida]|uniref:alpha-mannosidase n=1 Tax=Oceanivirga salmonicida TaxID=1769291 RepID=UPI000A969F61|nr:alpha-mannosidase [Oceanivirga salmonicida]